MKKILIFTIVVLINKLLFSQNIPISDFTCDSTSGYPSDCTVYFKDLSTNNPVSWEWYFLGGSPSSSTDQNPTVYYPTPGYFDVRLITQNQWGTDTLTKTQYIHFAVTCNCVEQSSITDYKTAIIELFPNPIRIKSTMKFSQKLNNAYFILYNIQGLQVRWIGNIKEDNIIIERENLPQGLYFYTIIESKRHIFSGKLLITD